MIQVNHYQLLEARQFDPVKKSAEEARPFEKHHDPLYSEAKPHFDVQLFGFD